MREFVPSSPRSPTLLPSSSHYTWPASTASPSMSPSKQNQRQHATSRQNPNWTALISQTQQTAAADWRAGTDSQVQLSPLIQYSSKQRRAQAVAEIVEWNNKFTALFLCALDGRQPQITMRQIISVRWNLRNYSPSSSPSPSPPPPISILSSLVVL